MQKTVIAAIIVIFSAAHANAQLGVMRLVGKNTSDYTIGFGAFIKSGFPVMDGSVITLELGANIFILNDGYDGDGTIMCPLKAGYRYTLNGTDEGFYVEPQIGFNLVGVTSQHARDGEPENLKYHGVVFAVGGGYLFSIGRAPFDLNLRYETVIAHGGSNNMISLGISRFISFGRRDSGY